MVTEPAPAETSGEQIEDEGFRHGYWGRLRPSTSATAVKVEVLDISGTFVPYSSYYWTEEWQEGEHGAQAEIDAGRTLSFTSLDDYLESLEEAEE